MKICFFIIVFIIATIYPFSPLNKWLLHNKWNHSDWATFLGGFLGAFITLFGVWWQVTKTQKQKEKDEMKNHLLGLKYNLEKNIKKFDYLYKNIIIFSYTLRSFYDRIDKGFFEEIDSNGVFIDTKIFNLNFTNDILDLKNLINEYNKNYIYLLNNVNEKNQILKKYKGENKNIKKNINNIIFLSELAIKLSQKDVKDNKTDIDDNDKKELKKIDEDLELYNSFYFPEGLLLGDTNWENNLKNSPKNLQAFFLMKVLTKLLLKYFSLLKAENYNKDEYVEIRKDIFNFWSREDTILKINTYKLIEDMKELKEKIEKELKKYK